PVGRRGRQGATCAFSILRYILCSEKSAMVTLPRKAAPPRIPVDADADIERRIADRLARLRAEHGLSLDALAEQTGISRATLSRLERSELSPSAAILGKLCAAYGWTLSRLMAAAENQPPSLVPAAAQTQWKDPESGYRRRVVSPPAPGLR